MYDKPEFAENIDSIVKKSTTSMGMINRAFTLMKNAFLKNHFLEHVEHGGLIYSFGGLFLTTIRKSHFKDFCWLFQLKIVAES